ncbi:MAG TPA: glycosyltransferase family 4 protein [Methylomirabilota bacterium]|nr:glycosyltransferase family 4 protein [Methylomirabilota bacterium]
MSSPAAFRLTVVMTHPVQYMSPWFRHIAARCPEIDLTVLYAVEPTPEQQGTGFRQAFRWDVPLTDGYHCRVLRPARPGESVDSQRFWGVNVPDIGAAIREARPEVVLIPGWHSVTLLRALWACWRQGIPVLYRGDTHLGSAPAGPARVLWTVRTRLLLRLFDGYLSVGRRSRGYLERLAPRGALVVESPHCVDNAFFDAAARSHQTASGRRAARGDFGLGAEDFVVALVGKLEAGKRPLDLVRAAARLTPSPSLLVVGAGELERECRSEAERLGVRVGWAGFLNQSELARAYAAADCLAVPSASESWGLTVNEALATGLPCVVGDRVGCAPDLIVPGETGEVFTSGDVRALAEALTRVRMRWSTGHDWAPACRARAATYSFQRATAGLLDACRALASRGPARRAAQQRPTGPRVLACCGGMVIVSGLERLTFEVLRVLRERGAAVHCIVNSWENERIVPLAERIGAGWSTGAYRAPLTRRTRNPLLWARMAWDVLQTSAGLLRDARRFRPTHVLLPDFGTALRNGPALLVLRARGIPVVLRAANHPDRGRFYGWTWGRLLPLLVTRFVANSEFSADRMRSVGVPAHRTVTIPNTVSRRAALSGADADVVALVRSRRTVLGVGQIAPFKGTHLLVEAMLTLLAEGVDAQAVIVGRHPEWPPELQRYFRALEERVHRAGAGDRVRFVGEREGVLEIMRAAYVLAAPILQEETFGNVVLEARSVGLPVVAFATGALPELIDHGVTGYLCAESTTMALLDGLRYFLGDSERREKAAAAALAASERAEDPYARAQFERRWWELFSEGANP